MQDKKITFMYPVSSSTQAFGVPLATLAIRSLNFCKASDLCSSSNCDSSRELIPRYSLEC